MNTTVYFPTVIAQLDRVNAHKNQTYYESQLYNRHRKRKN
jgi:hypothetical protein